MKSVLISVQPKWCEKITHIIGKIDKKPIYEKRVEIRKTRPKLETPFKVYIYMTKAYDTIFGKGKPKKVCVGGGKVIAEFVCDRVQEYESEFVDDDCFEMIECIDRDEEGDATGFIEWSNDGNIPYLSTGFFKKCCVPYEELKKYIGLGFITFYGWHISDLVIYDEPKELSEFKTLCTKNIDCYLCNRYDHIRKNCNSTITKPPQSWCYVERRED